MLDYADLRPPGLRELYAVFSGTAIPCPVHRREQFQALADTLPLGWHEVGWYLYWLIVDRFDLRVLIQYNRILAERTVAKYRSIVINHPTATWEVMLANPVYRDRVDTPPVLRYVLYLREDPAYAEEYLCLHPVPILSAYLGEIRLRSCLDPEAEERLWTHAVSLCACSTRP